MYGPARIIFNLPASGANITANVSESGDSVSAALDVLLEITANISETGDSVSAAMDALVQITANIAESGDTAAAALVGQIFANITANVSEQGDSVAAAMQVINELTANVTEAGDSVVAALEVLAQITANVAETGDAVAASITTTTSITANVTEDGDTVSAALESFRNITANVLEAGDTVIASLINPDLPTEQGMPAPSSREVREKRKSVKKRPRGWEPFDISYFRTKYARLSRAKGQVKKPSEPAEEITPKEIDQDISRLNFIIETLEEEKARELLESIGKSASESARQQEIIDQLEAERIQAREALLYAIAVQKKQRNTMAVIDAATIYYF